jgi:cell division septal protein FtsQ
MRRYESEQEKEAKRIQARKNIEETPPEKGDFLAMVIAAFIVLLPVILIVIGVFVLVMLLIFG